MCCTMELEAWTDARFNLRLRYNEALANCFRESNSILRKLFSFYGDGNSLSEY
jgi:hypothetical protein